ncbi:hypothetical protein Tco_0564127 [Tanacetum coccineum]
MTSEVTHSKKINETGINKNKPPRFDQDVQEKPHDDGEKNKSSSIRERTTQPVKNHNNPLFFQTGSKDLAARSLIYVLEADNGVLTEREIANEFSDEHLMELKSKSNNDEPWIQFHRVNIKNSSRLEGLIKCSDLV